METDLVPGKYQLTESENFDNFMGALGVGYLVRKLGNRSKPLVTLSQEGKEWTMKSESLVKTTESKFEMDKQFEELTADGRKVLTTMKVTAPQHRLPGDARHQRRQGQLLHQGVHGGEDEVRVQRRGRGHHQVVHQAVAVE